MSALRAVPAKSAILSDALRLIRKRRGLRQVDVAEAMGLPIRTYQNFEAGRIHLDFEKIKGFAAATESDPHAILAAVMIGSPAFALRSTENKLTSVLMTALKRFDERLGDDIARIEVGRLIKAFRKTFDDLETELAARDAQARAWFGSGDPPVPKPDDDDDATEDARRSPFASQGLQPPANHRSWPQMRTDLKHLPGGKQRELAYLVDILLEEFGKIIATRKAPRLKGGQVLKIILFGSYARGDWVEDPIGRYFSDYDLLIIVDHEDLADTVEFWETAEARILRELSAGQNLRTPVNFIVHSLQDVNHQLERGRYFFVDIVRDGILLHNLPGHPLANPTALSPETALDEAKGYFEQWMESALEAFGTHELVLAKGWHKKAAYELHQAAEHLYNCLLLVVTLYTPKSHNLVRLRNLAEPLDPRLAAIWPTNTKFEKRCFELLRAAYIKARYSKHYKITPEELTWLAERVNVLQETVREICEEEIVRLRDAAA